MRPLALLAIAIIVPHLAIGQESAEKEAAALAAKARERAKAKDVEQAIALMLKAIALAPNDHHLLAMTSDFEMKAGKFSDGLAHAQAAIKLNDTVGGYYVLAAANAYWEQELDLSREYCDRILKGGAKEFGPAAVNDARFLLDQLGKKTFTLFFNLDPQKGRAANGVYTIALPKDSLLNQKVAWEIGPVKSHRLVKGDVNDLLNVTPNGNKPFSLTIKITTESHSFKKELLKAAEKPAPAKPYSKEALANLGAIVAMDPKSPALKKIVADLKGKDQVATVRNIQAWMKKNIEYKLEQASPTKLDFKSVEEIVKRGHAECRGYALLFTALCRAADVPARPIWGLLKPPPGADRKFGDIVSHNWAEVYFPSCGWVPVDPQRPETLGFLPTDYLRFFMDAQKNENSLETLPVLNLMVMHGDRLRFEESR